MKHHRRTFLILTGLILITLPLAVPAQQSYTEDFTTTTYKDAVNTIADWNTADGELKLFPFELSLAGSYDTSGQSYDVVVAGDHAFVADGNSGLQVIDISDPANPTFADSYNTSGSAYGVAVAGNHAFVADGDAGLQVIDISDPTNLALAGTYDTPDYARCVAIAGDQVYLANGTSGLLVIDISDPTNPTLAGSYDTSGVAYGVAVAGNYAFVADFTSGFQVIDISDPTNPTLAGSYDTLGDASDVVISGDHAFIAAGSGGLQVLDISDPTAPTLAGSYDAPGFAYNVAVDGNNCYLGKGTSGVEVLDVSDPTSPTSVHSLSGLGDVRGVCVAGEHTYLGARTSGLQVIRTSIFMPPVLTGSYHTPGAASGVSVSGDIAYVGEYGGVRVIDISDPANPSQVGIYNMVGNITDVAVAGDYAFVANQENGLQVLDISDPTNPTLAGSYNTSGSAFGVAVTGDHAFVADYGSGLQVIDISDPTSPTLAGSYNTSSWAYRVAVAGDHAFIANRESGLVVIDISDPTNPTLAGSYNTPNQSYDVVVDGNHAFVADRSSGLQVIDISDPTSPTLAGSYNTPGYAWGMAVTGDHAFVADGDSGLQVIDISDPTNPTLADSYNTSGSAQNVVVSGNHAFVADDDDGLKVIQVRQDEFDTDNNIGQSSDIDGSTDTILRAKLSSTETSGVSWEVTADAGANWQAIVSDGAWNTITVPGDDLLWRSAHTWSPGFNPTVSDLQIDWLSEFAPITSVTDVPDDQGGWVRMNFTRSGYDFADEGSLPVTSYQIYRRVDNPPLAARIRLEGLMPSTTKHMGTALASRIRALEGRDYFLGGTGERGEYPPGVWEVIAQVIATQQDSYTISVPTLADSTAGGGIDWSVHFITTHTTTPSIWFASEPDSGYSMDNIAPGVPGGFLVDHDYGNGPSLVWDENGEEDFQYYRVYRGLSEEFEIGPEALIHETAETAWLDTEGGTEHFYKVTALDHAGNESDPASPDAVTGSEAGAPAAFALHQNSPNPFNPVTTISFDLPRTSNVRLDIIDVQGRRIVTLLDESHEAGRHAVTWRGLDDAGHSVSSGMYFYRLSTDGFNETRKMLLLQ